MRSHTQQAARPSTSAARSHTRLVVRSERASGVQLAVKTAHHATLGNNRPIGASSQTGAVGEITMSRAPANWGAKYAGAMFSFSLLAAPAAMADELWIGTATNDELFVEAGFLVGFLLLVVLSLGVAYLGFSDWRDTQKVKEETEVAAAKEAKKLRQNAPKRAPDPTKPKGFGEK